MNLLVGDSHSQYIYFSGSKHLDCSAGSAKGLNNPNSKSKYNQMIFYNVITNNYNNLFFLFGGVDVDFIFIHKYLDNNNISYQEFVEDVVKHYVQFIKTNFGNRSVVILSIGLPCLDDENFVKGMLNGHVSFLEDIDMKKLEEKLSKCTLYPNIEKRTEITMYFNKILEEQIKLVNMPNIRFLDVTTFTYDPVKRRIKDEFFSRKDHHNFDRNYTVGKLIDKYLKTYLHPKTGEIA